MAAAKWALVCVVLLLLTARALGLATEHHGNAPIGPGWNIPADVLAAVNLESRVYWREINGDPQFFFRGNTEALNRALEVFAKIHGDKEILIVPGPSDVRTLVEQKRVPCDWDLHAPNGFYVHFAKQEKGTRVMTKHPRLMIYVTTAGRAAPADAKQVERWIADLDSDTFAAREKATQELVKLGGAAAPALKKAREMKPSAELLQRITRLLENLDGIDLTLLRLPAGVPVLTLKDRHEHCLEGLKSADSSIRGHAVGGLSGVGRYTDDVIPTLLDVLKNDRHEYVRRYAAGALSHLGKRAAAALPTLKEGLNDPDVNVRNAFQSAIDTIEKAKDEQLTPEQMKQLQSLREKIQQFREQAARAGTKDK